MSRDRGEWLSGTGPESDVVLSSRIRLARNLGGYAFPARLTAPGKRAELERFVRERLEDAVPELEYRGLSELQGLEAQCLVERQLISKELQQGDGERGVAFTPCERLSIMVNEEDHLRVQVLRSGLQLSEAWKQMREVDEELESRFDFAYSPRFGYLTACPTNLGTGLRVSLMLHLPALVLSKTAGKAFKAMNNIDLAVRGFYGEGSQAFGDFFQISNQVTLGCSEEEIIRKIEDHVPQLIRRERNTREKLIEANRVNLEDRVWRAYGVLERAREMRSEEAMDYLSAVRMGITLGLIDTLSAETINGLFIEIQSGHLQRLEGRELEAAERSERRASLIRERLTDARS